MPDNKQAEEAAIYNAAIKVLVEQNHELQRQIRVLKAASLHSDELERVRDEFAIKYGQYLFSLVGKDFINDPVKLLSQFKNQQNDGPGNG